MVWVWSRPRENDEWGANIDYDLSAPVTGVEYLSDKPVNTELRPTFKSNTSLKKFKKLHCPPIDTMQTVDALWKSIILKFVPQERVQFLPIRLIARGEICEDFMWVIPFDRVFSIDKQKSDITQKRELPDKTLIFGVRTFVHLPNCMGNLHLARDKEMPTHMLVSNELKDALSATGQSSPFFRAEEVPTIYNI